MAKTPCLCVECLLSALAPFIDGELDRAFQADADVEKFRFNLERVPILGAVVLRDTLDATDWAIIAQALQIAEATREPGNDTFHVKRLKYSSLMIAQRMDLTPGRNPTNDKANESQC